MNVLVIGGGGREHTIVWKLAQSPKVKKLYAIPGGPGMMGLAECVPHGCDQSWKVWPSGPKRMPST